MAKFNGMEFIKAGSKAANVIAQASISGKMPYTHDPTLEAGQVNLRIRLAESRKQPTTVVLLARPAPLMGLGRLGELGQAQGKTNKSSEARNDGNHIRTVPTILVVPYEAHRLCIAIQLHALHFNASHYGRASFILGCL